jgi:phage FluMu gp28-like protein
LSGGWYEREHHRLRQRLEERDLTVPRDEDVGDDLRSWRVSESGKLELGPETKSKRDGLPRHGDTSVALLLAQSLAPDVPQAPKYRDLRRASPRGRAIP